MRAPVVAWLAPASDHLFSEVAIIARLARAPFGGDHGVLWSTFETGYDSTRDSISRVVPGCEDCTLACSSPTISCPSARRSTAESSL